MFFFFFPKRVTFKARRHGTGYEKSRTVSKVLLEFKAEGCSDHSVADFDRKPIQVPPCPPTGLEGCSIIHIDYFIKVIILQVNVVLDVILMSPFSWGNCDFLE